MSASKLAESKSLSILIVDDEVNVAAELADAAEDEGYTVHQANSAAAAMAILLEDDAIGVMISDIRMPDCDGLELTRRVLDGRDDTRALEVILITGHATLDDAVLAVRTGAFDFVRKPFRLQQIFEAVARAAARAIGRRRVAASLAEMEAQHGRAVPGVTEGSVHGSPEILLGLMHELRTPLVPILGFAEMLQTQRCSPTDTVEYARLIADGGRQLLATVDDLVLLAQIERGEVQKTRVAVVADVFLQELTTQHQSAAEFVGKSVRVNAASGLVLQADRALMRRALDVLMRIALQRNPRGTTVTLSAAATAEGTCIIVGSEPGGQDAARFSPSAFAEDVAVQVAPLGIRFARAVVALHGGNIFLSGEQNTAFGAFVALPEGRG